MLGGLQLRWVVVVRGHTEPFTGSLVLLSWNQGLVNVRHTNEHRWTLQESVRHSLLAPLLRAARWSREIKNIPGFDYSHDRQL